MDEGFWQSPNGCGADTAYAGYKIFAIGETGLIEVTEIGDQTVETNFLFVHSSQKSHFQTIAALAEKQLGSR
jgi:hypothetical protein